MRLEKMSGEVSFGIAYLFSLHSFSDSLYVVLYRQVDEFVLCFSLYHSGTLGPHHLDRALDVDLAVQT